MKSYLNHLQVNINPINLNFYKKLMAFLGWKIIIQGKNHTGYKSGTNGELWFEKSLKNHKSDYDNFGVNHIAIGVEKIEDVDKTAAYLTKQKIKPLFGTPKHRPEFCNIVSYYCQVMFESSDKPN